MTRLDEKDFEAVRSRCEAKAVEYIEAWESEPASRGRMIADLTKLLIPLTIEAEKVPALEAEVARLKEQREIEHAGKVPRGVQRHD